MSSKKDGKLDYRKVVTEFYKEYAPEKVKEVGKVLEHFRGRERELVSTLERKYRVVFKRDGTFQSIDEALEEEESEESYVTYLTEGDDSAEDGSDYDSEEETESEPEGEDFEYMFDGVGVTKAEVEFSMKSNREKAAQFAQAAAAIVRSRPPPRLVKQESKTSKASKSSGKSKRSNRSSKTPSRRHSSKRDSSSRKDQEKGSSKGANKRVSAGRKEAFDVSKYLPDRRNKHRDESLPESVHDKEDLVRRTGMPVWVPDEDSVWVRGTVQSAEKGQPVSVKLEGQRGKVVKVDLRDVEPVLSTPEHLVQVNDLTKLPALHEPALLEALNERFYKDKIYTFTGPILLAVNPFKNLNIYGAKEAKRYMETSRGFKASSHGGVRPVEFEPHPYKLADDAYRAMLDNGGTNQSILVSGESGAGKTETVKIVMNYLSYVSGAGQKKKGFISERVLQANPVLEAFGNAKTIRNDNSSRFGKLIQIQFDANRASMKGAYIESYLLEKARVVHQAPGERNYHIFYELEAGATSQQKKRWHFPKLKHCRYTGTSGTMSRNDIDDLAQFQTTIGAMQVLNFSPGDIERLFRTTVSILHIGNIEFSERTSSSGEPASKISNRDDSLSLAADLLEISADDLDKVLTTRKIHVGGETVVKPLSRRDASDARDALAMNLYERVFGWVVWRTNLSIGMDDKQYEAMLARQEQRRQYKERAKRRGETEEDLEDDRDEMGGDMGEERGGNLRVSLNRAFAQALGLSGLMKKKGAIVEKRQDHLIGCLDIFGFEVFETNSFEQLCINYTNEQLQQQFNEFVFKFEQEEYEREAIDWNYVAFPDNSKCIEMIEAKPMGLLSLIDEECMFPRGTDKSLIAKLHSNMPRRFPEHFLILPKDKANESFTVKHFAGSVTYSIHGFCVKNRNELHQEVVDVIRSSEDRLVSCLFPASADAAAGGADMASHFDNLLRGGDGVAGGSGGGRGRAGSFTNLGPNSGEGRGGAGKGGNKLLKKTVGAHFKTQLANALQVIRSSEAHFVRCLKPNDESRAGRFNRGRIVNQLRYSGVLELVKVTRAGYPSRFQLGAFIERFAVLSYGLKGAAKKASTVAKSGDQKTQLKVCEKICKNVKLKFGEDYQIGKTKVFLRQTALAYLEMKKAEKTYDCVVTIQRAFRRYRMEFRLHYYATVIQRNVRGWLVRRDVKDVLDDRAIAAEIIQTNPHFQRWLDNVMRKSRAERRKQKRKRRTRWRPPKWYENNRELVWWGLPVLLVYFGPSMSRGVLSFVWNHLLVSSLFLLALMGFVSGAFGVKMMPGLAGAKTGGKGQGFGRKKKNTRAAGRYGSSRRRSTKSSSSSTSGRLVRKASRAGSRMASAARNLYNRTKTPRHERKTRIHAPQVSAKFSVKAEKLRQEKSKKQQSRKSHAFEMPPVNNATSAPTRANMQRFRGLALNKK